MSAELCSLRGYEYLKAGSRPQNCRLSFFEVGEQCARKRKRGEVGVIFFVTTCHNLVEKNTAL